MASLCSARPLLGGWSLGRAVDFFHTAVIYCNMNLEGAQPGGRYEYLELYFQRQDNARIRDPTRTRGNLGGQYSPPPSNTAWRLTPHLPPFLAFHFPTMRIYFSSSGACIQSLPIEALFVPMSHGQRSPATCRGSCLQDGRHLPKSYSSQ